MILVDGKRDGGFYEGGEGSGVGDKEVDVN